MTFDQESRDGERTYRQSRFAPPPGATEILLVRHGASQAFRPGEPFPLVDGQGDPGLAPEGREQARRVCRRLAGEKLDAVYVSSLRRTAETAEPLVRELGVEPRVVPDLREVHLGEWEGGLFRMKVAENDPVAQRLFAEERWDVIPGAESAEAFAGRVRRVIGRLAAAHPGGRLAAFTHGAFIAQALALAAESRPFAFLGADNASISHLVVTGERWMVRRYNDTAHLDGALDASAAALT
ncbi:histidine phosphatase family protein [Thermomonospora cellulosilytica]|uniref:Putative phosphoglycerate mutase n=1 Tax=Thermomonospora cellulosilytica TaxID=1411118 RepID=A0A7W3N5E0_9ACTN|nr:histidine phosphatase family protein [Thermomonospora cellulosilytica]MBA9007788.1 putative phosphoglycerate mutase [Thermomonospora cellulosilytica]